MKAPGETVTISTDPPRTSTEPGRDVSGPCTPGAGRHGGPPAARETVATPPFFIVGAQRSGTTMLRLMLNQHPRLAVPFESGFITAYYEKLDEYGDLTVVENQRRLLNDISTYDWVVRGKLLQDIDAVLAHRIMDYADIVAAIYAEYARQKNKARWGDKTPRYTEHIEVLRHIFPNCKIIHLVRDGRDVALSLRRVSWGSSSIPRVALDWRWKTVLAHKMGALLGADFLEMRYEDLVLEPEANLRTICDFLGEAYTPDMLSYHRQAEFDLPEGSRKWHQSSLQAPNSNKVWEWKHAMSVADRIIFEQNAGDALELFGYEKERRARTFASRYWNLYYALVRRW